MYYISKFGHEQSKHYIEYTHLNKMKKCAFIAFEEKMYLHCKLLNNTLEIRKYQISLNYPGK